MDKKKELAENFQELNVTVSDEVLNKCLELCISYNIDPEDFCDQWYAFTASNLNGAFPTIEFLEKMERKELYKNKDQSFSRIKQEDIQDTKRKNPGEFESAVVSTPQSKIKTPKRFENSPLEYDPEHLYITDSSKKFSERTDSGSVKVSYGTSDSNFKRGNNITLPITEVEEHKITSDFEYMYQPLSQIAKSINRVLEQVGNEILSNSGLKEEWESVQTEGGYDGRHNVITYGRIQSDSDAKLNAQSVVFENMTINNVKYTGPLQLNKLKKYSLFPGQVVVAKGSIGTVKKEINGKKDINSYVFMAENIFTDIKLQLPQEVPLRNNSCQIVVGAGPYTFKENLLYEPLSALLQNVIDNEPHVLILMGPFLEHNRQLKGLNQTCDSFFTDLIENIMSELQHLDTHVVIVPSYQDMHSQYVYPTPAYKISQKYDKLIFVSDPGAIDIDGLRIMATTNDVLLHLISQELHYNSEAVINTGRVDRIISHILNQGCIYPLHPDQKNTPLDYPLLERYGFMKTKPHILLLPSNLVRFVKVVDDCVVINPENVTKGYKGGSFARIEVQPGDTQSVCNRSAVEVLSI